MARKPRSKAGQARAEAERRIAAARLAGATQLDLSGLADPSLLALDRIPDRIATLPALATLFLSRTQVTDLSPLAHLPALVALDLGATPVTDLSPLAHLPALATLNLWGTLVTDLSPLARLPALATLDLEGTRVTDLAPLADRTGIEGLGLADTPVTRDALQALRRLRRLVTHPGGPKDADGERMGLRLTNCAAAREDPRIAEIAGIKAPSARARALFEHLGMWEEDEAPGAAPEPDPELPAVIVDGKIEVALDEPSEVERDDAVKRAVHPRLLAKAADLAALARNRLPRLNRRAQALHRLLDCPFGSLDLLAVHYEVEDLNHRAGRGEEDGEAFGDEVDEALADIARLGPGLTRDHAAVELHEERLARTRAAPPPLQDVAAHEAASQAILAHPEAHGPRSLALENALAEASDPVRAEAVRKPKLRNMLWRLGVTAAAFSFGVAQSHTANVFGDHITLFLRSSWDVLVAAAETFGASFASWFVVATVGIAVMGKGVVDEWKKRQGKGNPPPTP